jgi:hypothetical protein
MYVSPTSILQPSLQYVIGVVGRKVYFETSLSATLSDIFQTAVSVTGEAPNGSTAPAPAATGTVPQAVQAALNQAQTDYTNAQAALAQGQLGAYQFDIAAMENQILTAVKAEQAAAAGGSSPVTTTTTTPKAKPKAKASTSTRNAPTSTQPKTTTTTASSTSTTQASAAAAH